MPNPTAEQSVRVIDLIPGDVVLYTPFHKAIFVSQTPHPIWPSLQLVIWKLHNGEWSLDALRPTQQVGSVQCKASERKGNLQKALLAS